MRRTPKDESLRGVYLLLLLCLYKLCHSQHRIIVIVMASKKVRVSLSINGNAKDVRAVMVTRGDWDDLVRAAQNKFRIKVKRFFTLDGQEITREDIESGANIVQEIYDNPKLAFVASDGKDFAGKVVDKKKSKDAMAAVGTFDAEHEKPQEIGEVQAVVRVLAKESVVDAEATKQVSSSTQLHHLIKV